SLRAHPRVTMATDTRSSAGVVCEVVMVASQYAVFDLDLPLPACPTWPGTRCRSAESKTRREHIRPTAGLEILLRLPSSAGKLLPALFASLADRALWHVVDL